MGTVMIIRALVVFACVCAASAATLQIIKTMSEEWNGFKTKYNKIYDSEYVEKMRFSVYLDNRQKIAKHNHKYELGLVTFTMAMNRFGDMTVSEFTRRMNGFNRTGTAQPHVSESSEAALFLAPANVELPTEIDWRKLGAVTPIKDQGECGSCWAFSATGALEGQHFRRNGTLISLSEQNLVDCSGRYGNQGCEGGLMDQAFQYVRANRGIDDERSYPYEAHDESCHYDPRHSAATDAGYADLPAGNEAKLQAAVATVGPISVAIDADHDSFMFYQSGVFYEPDCSSTFLDHGVLAVGYGADQQTGRPYWLVKNSWGKDWGEQGYVRMSRNRHNNCGIATMASYPLVK